MSASTADSPTTHARAPDEAPLASSAVIASTVAIPRMATATGADLDGARETVAALGDRAAAEALARVAKSIGVDVPLRARLATANADRMPGEVAGVVSDRDGHTTFYPADESLLPFDLDRAAAKDLPRGVMLVARTTKKKLEIVDASGNDATATVYRLRDERAARLAGKFTGVVDLVDGAPFIRDLVSRKFHALPSVADGGAKWIEGAVLSGHVDGAHVVIDGTLAEGHTAEARSWSVASSQHLDPAFPAQAIAEAKAINEASRTSSLDDPSLVDLRAEPFFAIDNHGSKDIDQAMRLKGRPDGGFVLQYALADMAHAVKPGMALWQEAMQRGASFYLPGINVPMQPREVCEQGVSLNAHEDHRAVVITIELDKEGNVETTSSSRAIIHSQAQLTYPGVSRFLEKSAVLDVDDQGHRVPPEVKGQLPIFEALGKALRERAHARGVVEPERREMRIGLDGAKFFLHEVESDWASLLNAQLSIVANCAGASMLASTGIPGIEAPAIFRVHPPPGPEKLAALRRQLAAIVDGNGAPASWKWGADETLADWVERLHHAPTNDVERGLSRALQGQVLGIQVSSEYARTPDLHSGLMVTAYGRFTAPMREVVGLLSHATLVQLDSLKRVRALGVSDDELVPLWKHMLLGAIVDPKELHAERAPLAHAATALEALRGPALLAAARATLSKISRMPPLTPDESSLVEQTFTRAAEVGNGARMKQKQCDTASMRLLFDDLFMRDLGGVAQGRDDAPVRTGTVIAASPGRVTVLLTEPDVEVKLGRDDLGDELLLERDGAELYCKRNGVERRLLVGATVNIKATHHDGEKLHFAIVD